MSWTWARLRIYGCGGSVGAGNSGVILSQFCEDLPGPFRERKCRHSPALRAFQYGVVMAYRAVTKPVEGTILTVAGNGQRRQKGLKENPSLVELLEVVVQAGWDAWSGQRNSCLPEGGVVVPVGAVLLSLKASSKLPGVKHYLHRRNFRSLQPGESAGCWR